MLQQRVQLDAAGTSFWRRRFTYTRAGLLASATEVRPGADLITTHTYTPAGWLASSTDPRGCTVTHTYDDLGREIGLDGGACGGRLSFSYLPDGSLEQASDLSSDITSSIAYDPAGRQLRVCATPAPCTEQAAETTYAYDATGRLASVSTAAGTTSYTYGTDGLLHEVDDPLSATGVSTYAYDAAGRVVSRTDAQAGITTSRTYEPQTSRVASQVVSGPGGTQLARFAASYDEAGHITSRTSVLGAPGSDPRGGTTTYAYDAAGRLVRERPRPHRPRGGRAHLHLRLRRGRQPELGRRGRAGRHLRPGRARPPDAPGSRNPGRPHG